MIHTRHPTGRNDILGSIRKGMITMNRFMKGRNTAVAAASVLLMLTVCLSPVLSDGSDAAGVAGTYDVYLNKGQTWTTSISYTASLSPAVSVKVATTESDASTTSGWSSPASDGTTVTGGTDSDTGVYTTASIVSSSSRADVSVKVGSSYTSQTAYVGIKLTTSSPTQSAVTVLRIHVLDMSFTTGYTSGNYYSGQTFTTQTPVVSTGNSGVTASSVTYSISSGSNSDTLSNNTGLSFSTTTGAISGTVSKTTSSQVSYTVVATMKFASGYPASQSVSTTVTIGTYASASVASDSAYAITGSTAVSVTNPTTSGITYTVSSATYTLNSGDSKSVSIGTAFNGIKVSSNGSVTGTPTVSGVYVITENLKVSETGQTTTRTVTITAEDQVKVKVTKDTVNMYTGNAVAGAAVTTASHTETNQVSGSWSVTSGNTAGYFAISSSGAVTVSKAPAAGTYTITLTYTSTKSTTNSATTTLKIFVDPKLSLSCTDSDKVLYAATESTFLDEGQDKATMNQTATLYAGEKKVTYSLSCSDSSAICDYVHIDEDGDISIDGTIANSCIGSHVITVTCTDDAVTANTATMNVTVTVVAAMSVTAPTVGEISSH